LRRKYVGYTNIYTTQHNTLNSHYLIQTFSNHCYPKYSYNFFNARFDSLLQSGNKQNRLFENRFSFYAAARKKRKRFSRFSFQASIVIDQRGFPEDPVSSLNPNCCCGVLWILALLSLDLIVRTTKMMLLLSRSLEGIWIRWFKTPCEEF
jgi:hypothetical protein